MLSFYESLLNRLEALHGDMTRCIAGLAPEALDWTPGEGMNSLTALVMHITQVERHLVGGRVGQDSTGRDAEAEFGASGLDEAALQQHMDDSLAHMRRIFEQLTLEDLRDQRKSPATGKFQTVGWLLCHTLDHTAEHLGQMAITRQLWDRQ